MSIKPKFFNSDERCETTFFLWDEQDGTVAVEATQRPQDVVWPRQVLRVVGPSAVTPPKTPMTGQEFTSWRQALDAAGFDFDVRSK
jgi:hypothetical protein